MNSTDSLNVTNVNHTPSENGGIAFLLANLAVYLPYTTIYSLAAVIGLLGMVLLLINLKGNDKCHVLIFVKSDEGNSLIIATIVVNKELHTTTNMLVFNLSLGKLHSG
jgi:hypothetical protein